MPTNDEIIKKNVDLIDYEDYDEMCRRFDVMLNEWIGFVWSHA